MRRSFDALAAGVQGAVTLHVRAVDRVGNIADTTTALAIDSQPPSLETTDADPQTRRVSVGVRDTSGIRAAEVLVNGHRLGLSSVGATTGTLRRLGVAVPTSVASDLDGVPAAITISDDAGNITSQTIVFHTRARTTITARTSSRRIRGGRTFTLRGSAAGANPARLPLIVTLINPHWPEFAQTLRVTTGADGRYALRIKPRMSGVVRVRFAGSDTLRSAARTLGTVHVKPTIRARFTRTSSGPSVSGTFAPGGGPPASLVWQARVGHGAWLTICRDDDLLRVGRRGKFTGRCHVRGLGPAVQLRVAYRADATGAYETAASR